MFNKKSIVLNGVDSSSQKAVLTLEEDGDMLNGRIRLYNFASPPKGIISLGIYSDGKVVKAGLTHTSGMLYTFLCQIPSMPSDFSCAVVNIINGEAKPILYGSSFNSSSQEEIYDKVITSLSGAQTMSEVEKVLDDYQIDFDDEEKAEIEKEIDKCMDNLGCDNCKDCKYKQYYFSNFDKADLVTSLAEEDKEVEEKKLEDNFYLEMKSQIDTLFENNPSEEYLEELIPNSKWVKVDIDNGDYYVLGLIYDDKKIKYICYGVPGVYQKKAPRELAGYPIWFPLDEEKSDGFGYWLSYQDADSGESVKAIIV